MRLTAGCQGRRGVPRPFAAAVCLALLGCGIAGCGPLGAVPSDGSVPVDETATPLRTHDDTIAFVRSTGRESDLLAVVTADGSVRGLVTGRGSVSTPAWSADGRSLAYAWRDPTEGGYRIRVADADGSNERTLTPGDAIDASPSWSPAGDRIAWSSNRGGDGFAIFLMGRDGMTGHDGTDAVRLIEGQAPAWSPTGDWIVFVREMDGRGDLFLVRPDGSGLRDLVAGPADDVDPTWTPDGTAVVFASDRAGDHDLYRVEVDGGAVEPILVESGADRDPAVSPDGSRIVFSRATAETADLWILDGDGTATQLTRDPRFDVDPAWQPLAGVQAGS